MSSSVSAILLSPFVEFAFMKRALAAATILALGGAPLGVFMTLRRMTLVGDALSHAILPGVAVSFFIAGLSLWAMTLGGLLAALLVALGAGFLTRTTQLKEDGAFALLSLLSLGAGVTLISLKGGGVDLVHVLFGNVLAIDGESLALMVGASSLSSFALAACYRRWVVEGFDPDFLAVVEGGRRGMGRTNVLFFALLMVNLVAAFQALGTLMALGLMILPALAAGFWARTVDKIMGLAVLIAVFSSFSGLLLSFHGNVPAGPAIVLVAGGMTLCSSFLGPVGSVRHYSSR